MMLRIAPDKEKAESILKMAEDTEKTINKIIQTMGLGDHQSLLATSYYDIIRELAGAISLINGIKFIRENSHKETINYLSNFKNISEKEILELQDLRIKRNNSSYEGKAIKTPYL